jgi:hypothetical protein
MAFDIIKQQEVRQFLKKVIIFLLLLISADYLLGTILKSTYYSQESGLEARTIYAVDKSNEELIILGSSRASHHYIPDTFTNVTHLTAYNAGREGNFILYHNAILQCMASRYKPKVVVLDILNKEFSVNQDSYDRLANLLPFYNSHKVIRPILNLRSPFEPIKNLSFIYPYNSKLQAIIMGNLQLNKKRKQDYKGYIPLGRVMERKPESVESETDYPVDSIKIAAYRSLLETCKNNNIQLFIVCSPYYDFLNKEDLSVTIASQIAGQYQIPFWDFSKSEEFVGKAEIFDDKAHLNEKGAAIYSKLIAERIADNKNLSAVGAAANRK